MNDFCPILGFDHIELYVGNARQAALFYDKCLGFTQTAYRGLETGERDLASYVLEQGEVRLVLTTALDPEHPVAQQVQRHGDCVGVIAIEVPDAFAAWQATTSRGAQSAFEPVESRDEGGVLRRAGLRIYGDTVLELIERAGYEGAFAPGFERRGTGSQNGHGVGLRGIDHVVGNVELGEMDRWVRFFAETMGFSQLVHFDDEAISTEYSALMSKVMFDGSGKIKFPINEPAEGRNKSQIQEFLDYHRGPGVQHIACLTDDIIGTVDALRRNGIDFLRVPGTYYQELEERVGEIEEPVDRLAELGILVDRDDDGYLLQIFTEPFEDRPTLFFEVIERHGARGFGEGNFKSLFEAIEREQAARGNL
jgi:4-hydroxyphenylpyruvate dioxygenase